MYVHSSIPSIQYYPRNAWSHEETICENIFTGSTLVSSTPGSYATFMFYGSFPILCILHMDLVLIEYRTSDVGYKLTISGVKSQNGGLLQISTNDIVSIVDLKSESNETCDILFSETFPKGYHRVNITLLPVTTPSMPTEVRLTDIS